MPCKIHIEKGIPIPDKRTGTRDSRFAGMEKTESILFKTRDLARALENYARRQGWKLTSRKVSNGFRYWRIG